MPQEVLSLAVLLHTSHVTQCLSCLCLRSCGAYTLLQNLLRTLNCASCLDALVLPMFGSQNIVKKVYTAVLLIHARQMCMQNPDDKREVICDDVLRRLTGKDKFLAFGGQKHFGHHILK